MTQLHHIYVAAPSFKQVRCIRTTPRAVLSQRGAGLACLVMGRIPGRLGRWPRHGHTTVRFVFARGGWADRG